MCPGGSEEVPTLLWLEEIAEVTEGAPKCVQRFGLRLCADALALILAKACSIGFK